MDGAFVALLNLVAILMLPISSAMIAQVVSRETGLFAVFFLLRDKIGIRHKPITLEPYIDPATTRVGGLADMVHCPFCLSFWVGCAAAVAAFVAWLFGFLHILLFLQLPFLSMYIIWGGRR